MKIRIRLIDKVSFDTTTDNFINLLDIWMKAIKEQRIIIFGHPRYAVNANHIVTIEEIPE